MQLLRSILATFVVTTVSLAFTLAANAQSNIAMVERFVPHTSTAPANKGDRVGLYLREKMSVASADRWASGTSREGRPYHWHCLESGFAENEIKVWLL